MVRVLVAFLLMDDHPGVRALPARNPITTGISSEMRFPEIGQGSNGEARSQPGDKLRRRAGALRSSANAFAGARGHGKRIHGHGNGLLAALAPGS
jgi:hypothetical protein